MRINGYFLTIVSNWGARAISIAVQLITIPLITSLLSLHQFAAYAIMISLMSWYALLDFGFGNASQNIVTEKYVKNEDFSDYISTVFFLSILLVICVLIMLFPLAFVIKNILFHNFSDLNNIFLCIYMSGVFFTINALGVLSQKILYALRKGVLANFILIINSILTLLLFLSLNFFNYHGSYLLFACVFAYAFPLALTGGSVIFYIAWKYDGIKIPKMEDMFSFWKSAKKFSIFALMAVLVLNVDYIVMSQTLTSDQVAIYNILFRIFSVFIMLYSSIMSASWSLFVEMRVKKEYQKIKKNIIIYISSGIITVFCVGITLVFFIDEIIKILMPKFNIHISIASLVLFVCYVCLRVWTDTFTMVLQSFGKVDVFIKIVPIQAAVSITFQYYLSSFYGVNGIIAGLIISFLTTVVWYLPLVLSRYLNYVDVSSEGR